MLIEAAGIETEACGLIITVEWVAGQSRVRAEAYMPGHGNPDREFPEFPADRSRVNYMDFRSFHDQIRIRSLRP
jgi:hypothetical protein